MPWTIPDQGEGANDIQSILFQECLEVLTAGACGIDFVSVGCAVTAQATPDMTLAVAAGLVVSNGIPKAVTAGNVTITAAHATLPRLDYVVVDSAGTKAVRAGTAATAPKPPARTANDVVLAQVYVAAADTAIQTADFYDRRMLKPWDTLRIALSAAAAANATVTGVEITGLALRLEPGTYDFAYTITYQAAAATTGVMFGVNHTGTATVVANMEYQESTTAASTGAASQASGVGGKLVAGSGTRILSTTAPNLGPTISVDTINANMLMLIYGKITVTAAGNIALWHASEVAASSQVMAESSLVVTRVR